MNVSKPLLSFSLVTGLLTLIGCGDPGLCTRGEPGCACTEILERCDDGSACDEGMCPAAQAGSGGTGGDGGTGGSGGSQCVGEAPPDQVCQPLTGSVCSQATTALQACVWACEIYCRQQDMFCGEPCPAGFCEADVTSPGVSTCLESGTATTLAAAKTFCSDFETLPCAQVLCASNETPTCSETCDDQCGPVTDPTNKPNGDWADDGYCDDGGRGADYSECAWGFDCTDCKTTLGLEPRLGQQPSACNPIGGCCRFTSECCGTDGAVHCLGGDIAHCRTDCTDTRSCAEGFDCRSIVDVNDQPTGDFACIPCG